MSTFALFMIVCALLGVGYEIANLRRTVKIVLIEIYEHSLQFKEKK